jgi:ribosomal protein S18 acetylase RimI-like enzyme
MIADAAEARRIEDLLLNATQPAQQLQYDGWLLRLAGNDVKRASSVMAAYGSSLPLDQKIEHCERVYAERGLPAIFRLTPFSQPPGLDEALATRGYERFERTLCLSAPLEALPPARDDVRFERPNLSRWLDTAAGLHGLTPERAQAEYERLFESTLPGFSLIAWRGEEAVACGLIMVEDDYAGVFDVCTAESWRRQGIGTAIAVELMRTARLHGAQRAWLSVLSDNEPALRVYEKLGFRAVYDYWYRRKPGRQA